MATERTWTIEDASGKHTVTLAQFRAEIDTRKAAAQPIADAWHRGNIAGVEAAQTHFRARFK